jgi:hypothetical protein
MGDDETTQCTTTVAFDEQAQSWCELRIQWAGED